MRKNMPYASFGKIYDRIGLFAYNRHP